MRESMETFIEGSENDAIVHALDSLTSLRPRPLKLFVEGPCQAGKSTLVRSWSADAARNGAGATIFSCSGADIAMALQFEAAPSFFEKLGAAPVLLIDDIKPLLQADRGDQLLALMLAERDRLKLNTVITSRTPLAECAFDLSREPMDSFEVAHMEPLGKNGKCAFVRMAASEYATEASPTLDDEAVACIVELMGESFESLENATRYLMEDADCAVEATLNETTVKRLLQL